MAELVDAPASGAGDRKVVEVRVLFWAPATLKALKMLGDRPKDGPQRAFATANCYGMMAYRRPKSPGKPSVLRAVVATVSCYGICRVASFDEGTNSTIATLSRLTLSAC